MGHVVRVHWCAVYHDVRGDVAWYTQVHMVLNAHFFILIGGVAIVLFGLGALWYGPLIFGKRWMHIHGADKYSKDELARMQKEMMPAFVVQFLLTIVQVGVLFVLLYELVPKTFIDIGLPAYTYDFVTTLEYAALFWVGFVVPLQAGVVMWGSDAKKWWLQKCAIMGGYQALSLAIVVAAFVWFA